MKALRYIFSLSILHFVAAIGLFSHSFGSAMSSMDTGEMSSMFDRVCDVAGNVLWFPFLQVAAATNVGGGSLAEWSLFFSNSLLWGVMLYAVILGCRRLLRFRNHRDSHGHVT